MHPFDDDFLDHHGLAGLPHPARALLADQLARELENLVGRRITEGMSDPQLAEFSAIIDGEPRALADFLARHRPHWETDADYLRAAEACGPDDSSLESIVDYASRAWLDIHRPDFRSCVTGAIETLAAWVASQAPEILSDAAAGSPAVLRLPAAH